MVESVNAIQATDSSDLVEKPDDDDAKIKNIEKGIPNNDKYITTNDFNNFSRAIIKERLKQARLAQQLMILILLNIVPSINK